jgi:hypothetical protein
VKVTAYLCGSGYAHIHKLRVVSYKGSSKGIDMGPFEQLKYRLPLYFSVIFNTNHLIQIGIVQRMICKYIFLDSLSITNINFALWSVSRDDNGI